MNRLLKTEAGVDACREIVLVAMTRERLIGAGSHIPWSLPQELRLFRQLTLGGTVVMGRNTFESLGRPLEQRHNIVVSTTLKERPGITVCRDFPAAVVAAESHGGKVFYIGGREIFRLALQRAELLRVSWIPGNYTGDCYFPEFDRKQWCLAEAKDYGDFVHECFLPRC